MPDPNKNDLIDGDFISDRNEGDITAGYDDFSNEVDVAMDDLAGNQPAKKQDTSASQNDDIQIEVVDDTPDKDRGKWIVDDKKDGEPHLPEDDELKRYSEDAQKRIKQYTARSHAERRAREAIERQLQEAEKVIRSLSERSNKMAELLEGGEKVLVTEHRSRIEEQLKAAKQAYREAHEAGDAMGMANAQEAISKAAAAMDRLSVHRPQAMPRVDPRQFANLFAQQQQQQKAQPSREALDWQKKNGWFGKDEVMTAFAMGLHSKIVNRDGISPEDPQYWRALDKEIQTRFPERFQGQRRSTSPVAPVSRSAGNGPVRVTLTETQVKLAKRLGITPQDYARELLKQEKSR